VLKLLYNNAKEEQHMSKRPRRNHAPAFKAKVALDALKGEQTLVELSQRYQIHPNQITEWKKQLMINHKISSSSSQKKMSSPRQSLSWRFHQLQQKHRRMFENIQDVYYETDMEGVILEVSPSVNLRFGWSEKEWLGTFLQDYLVERNQWDDLIIKLKNIPNIIDNEMTIMHRSGSPIPCSVNARIITVEEEPASRIIGLIRDISERKRLEEELRESEKKYQELSITDGLTKLFNLRHFYELIGIEIRRVRRYAHPLSLFLMDIDNFKKVNDVYGHQCGDEVLKRLAEVIQNNIRGIDKAFRYGGEEFVAILPETPKDLGVLIAERIRKEFENQTFSFNQTQLKNVTISIGVSAYLPPEDGTSFIRRTDENMYQAKKLGKNRVYFS
jgi:diguanylate cyclase (GGDEF)-like protein/PAS domain S-box-containing protein